MQWAISASHISKSFSLQHQQYYSLRDSLSSLVNRTWFRHQPRETFWALKDVSFNIAPGEAVGIIGPNGAGKSTLLKVLSRITPPTSGLAKISGRVGSLLEVGTGFHQELTGRENIYLNGAILGMTRAEISRKFAAIVEFADADKFLDTQVKHYSSGMYVRLAFSVAAHLQPDIMFVDEVLSVGDAEFQKRSLDKMGQVTSSGRTVLFVSHNLGAIRRLCPKSLYLNHGHMVYYGETSKAITKYLSSLPRTSSLEQVKKQIQILPLDPVFKVTGVSLKQKTVNPVIIITGQSLTVEIRYRILIPVGQFRLYFDLLDLEGNLLFRSFYDDQTSQMMHLVPGEYISRAVIPENFLAPTSYILNINSAIYNVRSCMGTGLNLQLDIIRDGLVNSSYPSDLIRGKIAPLISWKNQKVE